MWGCYDLEFVKSIISGWIFILVHYKTEINWGVGNNYFVSMICLSELIVHSNEQR